jgi:hypothetical protein
MTDPKQSPEAKEEGTRGTPYSQMSSARKVRFILKVVLCVLSFGMIFPNVMGD